jgi:hypothetical protein
MRVRLPLRPSSPSALSPAFGLALGIVVGLTAACGDGGGSGGSPAADVGAGGDTPRPDVGPIGGGGVGGGAGGGGSAGGGGGGAGGGAGNGGVPVGGETGGSGGQGGGNGGHAGGAGGETGGAGGDGGHTGGAGGNNGGHGGSPGGGGGTGGVPVGGGGSGGQAGGTGGDPVGGSMGGSGGDPAPDAALPGDDARVPSLDAAIPLPDGAVVPGCVFDWECDDFDHLCIGGACVPNPATLACLDMPVIDGPVELDLVIPPTNTRLFACGFASGPEVAFSLPATANTYCVSTVGSPGDTVLAVRPDCLDDSGDVVCMDDIAGRVRAAEITVGPHEADYALIIDSFALDGPVHLSVMRGPCLPRAACGSDADCVGFDEVCELGQCWPVPGRDACEGLCQEFALCAGAADTPCTCNGPGHEAFYERTCLETCSVTTIAAVQDAIGACDRFVPAMTAANPAADAACSPADPALCVFDVEAGAPLPACVEYATRLVECITPTCDGVVPYAEQLRDGLAAQCTDSFTSPFDVPVASGPEELLALAGLDCATPELRPHWRAIVDPDYGADRRLVLGTVCDTGEPNNDDETCTLYCGTVAACDGPDATMPDAQCRARCQLSDTVRTIAYCGALSPFDCDAYYGCTHGDYALDHPDTLAIFPADYTFSAGRCLSALPESPGQMLAARLFPPTYPYRVDAVEYVLQHFPAFGSDAARAHDVEIWVQRAFEPEASPAALRGQRIAVPATALDPDRLRRVRLPLAAPVRLDDGDVLFVAVHLTAGEAGALCVAGGADFAPEGSFWLSESAAAPFTWSPLDALFVTDPFAIFALGTAL